MVGIDAQYYRKRVIAKDKNYKLDLNSSCFIAFLFFLYIIIMMKILNI